MINKLAQEIHKNAKAKGFYETERNIAEMLCLIHSEVSEALECDRKTKEVKQPLKWEDDSAFKILYYESDDDFNEKFEENIKDTFADELADVMIRVMDLAAYKNIDLESHIKAKMRYNSLRPHKHNKKY